MQRFLLVALVSILALVPARALDSGNSDTIAYIQKLQTKGGGFLTQEPTAENKGSPTLRATSSAVRALQYFKGTIPDREACLAFVAACHDLKSGGFADVPKGKTDVATTAIGLMAIKTLNMPADRFGPGAVKFMTENARSFEEIRIAAAGLEAMQDKSPKAKAWLDEVENMAKTGGVFGQEAGQARDTASAVVTILRLGGSPPDKELVLKVLRAGQRLNGGFGAEDNETASDLESCYRVMRCFIMLKAQPYRVEGLRTFVAKCRNEDGGYGIAPGQPSSISGTYFAASIRHWLKDEFATK